MSEIGGFEIVFATPGSEDGLNVNDSSGLGKLTVNFDTAITGLDFAKLAGLVNASASVNDAAAVLRTMVTRNFNLIDDDMLKALFGADGLEIHTEEDGGSLGFEIL